MTRARGGRPRKCLWNNRILIEWEQEPWNREKAILFLYKMFDKPTC